MDFGCGTGVLFDELSRAAERVFGVDIVLEPARLLVDEWDLKQVTLMDPATAAEKIAGNSLDAIVAAEVLEHIDPLDDTLEFFRNWLKPAGKLLVSVPTENALYRLGRRVAGFENHYHESNAEAIHRKILASGFRELSIARIPAPGPMAIYWVGAYGLS
jgi:2-polyprenyl-3-methyl-5-hydroxy-6-metoxy-1,4-benzoquinol methylase